MQKHQFRFKGMSNSHTRGCEPRPLCKNTTHFQMTKEELAMSYDAETAIIDTADAKRERKRVMRAYNETFHYKKYRTA